VQVVTLLGIVYLLFFGFMPDKTIGEVSEANVSRADFSKKKWG